MGYYRECRSGDGPGIAVKAKVMCSIRLHLPEYLHATARTLAEQEDISLNQLITLALAEKVSALLTEEHLKERAQRGNKKKFQRVLNKVPDVEPAEEDRVG